MTMPNEERQSRRRREDDDNGGKAPQQSGMGRLVAIALPVIISLVIGFLYLNSGVIPKLVTRTDFTTNFNTVVADMTLLKTTIASFPNSITSLSTQAGQLNDKITTLNQAIANINAGGSNYASKDSVAQFNSNVASIQNSLNILQTTLSKIGDGAISLTSLQTTITTLNKQLTDAVVRIKVLEDAQTVTPTTTADLLTFTVNTISNMPVTMTISANNTVYSGTWQLIVKNNTNKIIDQLVLGVGVVSATGTPFPTTMWASGYPQLISNGGSVLWTYQPSGAGLMFVSGWGYGVSQLSIPANSQISLWLTLQLDVWFTTSPITPLYYQLVLQPFTQSYHQ